MHALEMSNINLFWNRAFRDIISVWTDEQVFDLKIRESRAIASARISARIDVYRLLLAVFSFWQSSVIIKSHFSNILLLLPFYICETNKIFIKIKVLKINILLG